MKNFGLIFDMDGVIVDSNPQHREAIQLFCKKYHKNISDDFLEKRIYGRANKDWIPEVFENITDALSSQYAWEKEALFREIFKPFLQPIAGLIPFLDALKKLNIKMAVATSAPAENADFILEGLQISNYFQAIFNSSHVVKSKPDPQIYRKACDAIGLASPDCIVIEDSLSGIKSGKAAGCKVIGITTTHSVAELQLCDMIIDDYNDLKIGQLSQLI